MPELSSLSSPTVDSSQAEMSASSKKMLEKVKRIVPPMLESFHKGQLGRVAVIGGSLDYTGAPYFSAMASARLGKSVLTIIRPLCYRGHQLIETDQLLKRVRSFSCDM